MRADQKQPRASACICANLLLSLGALGALGVLARRQAKKKHETHRVLLIRTLLSKNVPIASRLATIFWTSGGACDRLPGINPTRDRHCLLLFGRGGHDEMNDGSRWDPTRRLDR